MSSATHVLPNRGLVGLLADVSARMAAGQPVGVVRIQAALEGLAELLGRLEVFRPALVHAARADGLDWPTIAELLDVPVGELQAEYSLWAATRRGVA